jgi:hypothetical protein
MLNFPLTIPPICFARNLVSSNPLLAGLTGVRRTFADAHRPTAHLDDCRWIDEFCGQRVTCDGVYRKIRPFRLPEVLHHLAQQGKPTAIHKLNTKLAPHVGLEPTTLRLTAGSHLMECM